MVQRRSLGITYGIALKGGGKKTDLNLRRCARTDSRTFLSGIFSGLRPRPFTTTDLPQCGEGWTQNKTDSYFEPGYMPLERAVVPLAYLIRRCFFTVSITRLALSAHPDVPPMPGEHTASPTLNKFFTGVSLCIL